MTLAAGTRLGTYEILGLLGAGGMGEVYRAHDTRLGRLVAVKILPDRNLDDPDRLSRFTRESRVLASLNHAHIAAIYGVEETGDRHALVLELVEGDTLAERIGRGRLPVRTALQIAAQIADALEAAHQKGIVHRDLKPANVKVTPEGVVKVLDFGLAKAMLPDETAGDASECATMTVTGTRVGSVLGTPAYMSPEQAAGGVVDERADFWAFGAVLYEMLAGRRVFSGDSASDTVVHVLEHEPDWTALPPETPAAIRTLLRRCLTKNRQHRLDSALAARLEIDDALSPPIPGNDAATDGRRQSVAIVVAAFVAGIAAAAAAYWSFAPRSPAQPSLPMRFTIVPAPEHALAISGVYRDVALSPDGRQVVYRSQRAMAAGPLIVRSINELQGRPIEGVTNARDPFFSPDSRSVAFFDAAEIKKVALDGGPAIPISGYDAQLPAGASWGDDNTIVFATADPATGLWRVSADRGEPRQITTPDVNRGEGDHRFPSVLPGGRGVIYTIGGKRPEDSRIAVLDATGRSKLLVRSASHAEYVGSGHLVYVAGQGLHAVPFDLERLETRGDPVRVVDAVSVSPDGRANYAVSASGTLVYVTAGTTGLMTPRLLTWVHRSGREEPLGAPARPYIAPRVAPDGGRIAVDSREPAGSSIWMWDVARETLTKVVSGHLPTWTADGNRLVFQNPPNAGTLYWTAADGSAAVQRLTTTTLSQVPTSVTPDGFYVVGYQVSPETARDVYRLRLPDASHDSPGPIEPVIDTAADEQNGEVSPDGRYIAYQSNESGRLEVYVRTFPRADGGRWQASTSGGSRPVWSRTSRELFYVDADGAMKTVSVTISRNSLTLGSPVTLFRTASYAFPSGLRTYDVSADGQKFLLLKEASDPSSPQATLVIVLNWQEDLKQRVATR